MTNARRAADPPTRLLDAELGEALRARSRAPSPAAAVAQREADDEPPTTILDRGPDALHAEPVAPGASSRRDGSGRGGARAMTATLELPRADPATAAAGAAGWRRAQELARGPRPAAVARRWLLSAGAVALGCALAAALLVPAPPPRGSRARRSPPGTPSPTEQPVAAAVPAETGAVAPESAAAANPAPRSGAPVKPARPPQPFDHRQSAHAAAAALALGDYEGALTHYRALASRETGGHVHAEIARILARRLGEPCGPACAGARP